jgi:dTDP-4-dehydrorhamnose reductase
MTDKTYNGWTNYATWRVNLEVFDDFRVMDTELINDVYELGQYLRDTAEVYIEDTSTEDGLARDYALAFLSDVNWYEIAKHMIDDAKAEAEAPTNLSNT